VAKVWGGTGKIFGSRKKQSVFCEHWKKRKTLIIFVFQGEERKRGGEEGMHMGGGDPGDCSTRLNPRKKGTLSGGGGGGGTCHKKGASSESVD